ncbi:MAG: sensor histidine kinase [Kofleriaceae bacterium]|nr:sensor histidine kinase [Kofleriaceae bacterium]
MPQTKGGDVAAQSAFRQWSSDATRKRIQATSGLMVFVFSLALAIEFVVDSEEVERAAGTDWLPVQLLACVVCWICMRYMRFRQWHPAIVATPFYSLVSGTGGYYLGSMGGFDGPFFYSSYMIAPLLVFLPFPILIRVGMSVTIVCCFVAAYLIPHPEYLSYPLLHIPITYLVTGNIVAIALGHWGYKLARERFMLAELLSQYNVRLNDEVEQKTDEVTTLLDRMEDIRDSERADLARALHDDLGQLIVGARMEITNLERRFNADNDRDSVQELDFLAEIVEGLNCSSRTIIHGLRERDDNRPVANKLESLMQSVETRFPLTTTLTIGSGTDNLSGPVSEFVYRTCQEALTNIVKHSGASEVSINLSTQTVHESPVITLSLQIKDNGRGFTGQDIATHAIPADEAPQGGLGLKGMRERAFQLGGTLTITSVNTGTKITAHIPLPDKTQ